MNHLWVRQVIGMLRLELKKNLFSFRAVPIYLLAGLPVAFVALVVVVSLIAGISLFDGMLIAGAGQPWLAVVAVAGFALRTATLPVLAQPLWLDPRIGLFAVATARADPGGRATLAIPLPNTAAIRGVGLWLQPASPNRARVELAPVVGFSDAP